MRSQCNSTRLTLTITFFSDIDHGCLHRRKKESHKTATNSINTHMTPRLGIEPGVHWREASHRHHNFN